MTKPNLSILSAAAIALASSLSAATVYQPAGEIAVGGEGGWDCLKIDNATHRLYLSHASKFVVIDLEKNAVVGEIADTPGAHDIAIVPGAGRAFTSNGKEDKSSLVDLATLKTLSKVDTGKKPDIVLFESSQKEIYCFNADGNSVTVLNADTGKLVATIPLEGNPEFAACDPAAGKVYINIEDKSTVAVIDTKTHTVEANWPIAPGESASGMAIDIAHHRLFLGCDNKLMVMMDSTNGKVVANAPISQHIDGAAFDPGTQLAFASGGDGITTILHEDAPDKLTVVQSLETQPGARTMTVDEATHKIYLPTAKTEPVAPGTKEGEHHWPKILPGTLKVLVFAPVAK